MVLRTAYNLPSVECANIFYLERVFSTTSLFHAAAGLLIACFLPLLWNQTSSCWFNPSCQAHSVSIAVETPGSNGAFGPTSEVVASTFPHAPRLTMVEASRSDTQPSTVTIRYKLSEVSQSLSLCLCDKFELEYSANARGHPKGITGYFFYITACQSVDRRNSVKGKY